MGHYKKNYVRILQLQYQGKSEIHRFYHVHLQLVMNITDVDDKIIRKTNEANEVSDQTEIANTTWRDLKE